MDTLQPFDPAAVDPVAADCTARHVFFYDGVCVYCKGIVEACIAGDPDGQFHYSPLQSAFAQRVLGEYGIDSTKLLSMYVVSDLGSSDEALHRAAPASNFVLQRLQGELREIGSANSAKPRAQQDAEYKDTADHRYARYGTMDVVWVATDARRDRFIC